MERERRGRVLEEEEEEERKGRREEENRRRGRGDEYSIRYNIIIV